MYQLTEKQIIEFVLRYLRGYYKYYPREGDIEIKSNMRGSGGVVADGLLSFRQPDGKIFTVTFEATDYYKRGELRIRRQRALGLWDALAASYVALGACLGWAHISKHLGWMHKQPILFFLTCLIAIGLITLAVLFLLRPLRRYRYIYAIEQFRSYFADDQWVAFAWDVFPGYEDPNFKELRAQCVYNGYGLLEIDRENKVKLHVAPSQNDPPEQLRRRVISFFTESEFSKRIQTRVTAIGWREKVLRWFHWIPDQDNFENLLRFQRSFYPQYAIIAGALTIIGVVLFREYQKRPVIYVDESEYVSRLLEYRDSLEDHPVREYVPVLIDTAAVAPFLKNVEPYIKLIPEEIPETAFRFHKTEALVYRQGGLVEVPCDNIQYQFQGRYMVRLGQFFDVDYLKNSILRLREAGVPANGVWAGCLFSRQGYYAVYFDAVFPDLESAEATADQLAAVLERISMNIEVRIDRIE